MTRYLRHHSGHLCRAVASAGADPHKHVYALPSGRSVIRFHFRFLVLVELSPLGETSSGSAGKSIHFLFEEGIRYLMLHGSYPRMEQETSKDGDRS